MERPFGRCSPVGLKVLTDLLRFNGKPMDDVILAAIQFDGPENIQSAYQNSMNSQFGISILDTRDLRQLTLRNSEQEVASLIRTQHFCTGSHWYWSKALEESRFVTPKRVSIYDLGAIIRQCLNILDDRADSICQKRKVVIVQHERNQIRIMNSLKVLRYRNQKEIIHGVLNIAQIAADIFGYPRGQPKSVLTLSEELGLPFDRLELRTAGNDSNCMLRVLLLLAARYQEGLRCGEHQNNLVALLRQVAEAPLPPRRNKPKLECVRDLEPEEPLDEMPVDTSRFEIRISKKEARQRARERRAGGPIQKKGSPPEKQADQTEDNIGQDEASIDEEWTSKPGLEQLSAQ